MKSGFGLLYTILAVLAAALIIPAAVAQMGQGKGAGMGVAYDPSSVVTVSGTVQDVQENSMPAGKKGQMRGMDPMGTHLVIRTDKETITVLVGPSSYLQEKNFTFAKGDKIEVTGSKVKYMDADAIVAREIKKGDKTLTLRNESGVPAWSRGRRSS